MENWEGIYVHSVWMAELKFEIFIIDIGVWREFPEGMTNLIWIQCDHLKSIIKSACDSFGTSWSVRPNRDRVNFAEIVCQFRQVFIGVRLRFEKSSPR